MGNAKKQKKDETSPLSHQQVYLKPEYSFKIICQVPGISEEAIRIDLDGTQLIISTSNQHTTVVQQNYRPRRFIHLQKKSSVMEYWKLFSNGLFKP